MKTMSISWIVLSKINCVDDEFVYEAIIKQKEILKLVLLRDKITSGEHRCSIKLGQIISDV